MQRSDDNHSEVQLDELIPAFELTCEELGIASANHQARERGTAAIMAMYRLGPPNIKILKGEDSCTFEGGRGRRLKPTSP